MMVLNFVSLLCFIIIFTSSKCYNNSTLKEGIQIKNTIEPHEIYIHQFSSPNETLLFSFYAIEKETILYGFYSYNINSLNIQEKDIPLYLSKSLFFLPIVVNKISSLQVSLQFPNDIHNEEQYIIIVYCPLDIKCDYSIFFLSAPSYIVMGYYVPYSVTLLKNSPIILPNYNFAFSFHLPEDYTDNTTVLLSLTHFSGLMTINEITVNNTKIDCDRSIIGANEVVSFTTNSYSQNNITFNALIQSNVIFFEYSIKKNTELIYVDIDISQMHTISLNQTQFLTLSQNYFSDNPILLNIKAENCYLIANDISNKAEKYSDYPNYYQFIINEKENVKIELKMKSFDDIDNNNENDTCVYYTFALQDSQKEKIVIMEGVTYKTRLNKENKSIHLQFPFVRLDYYNYIIYQIDCVLLDIEASSNEKIYVFVTIDNTKVQKRYIQNGDSILLSNENLSKLCLIQKICLINIEIINQSEENYISFQIRGKKTVPHFIEKNKMKNEKMIAYFDTIYYTHVKHGDKGIVKFIYDSQKAKICYKIIEKKGNDNYNIKNKLFDNWSFSNSFNDEIEYDVNNTCYNGCMLLIEVYLEISEHLVINYNMFIDNDNQPIKSLTNQKIKGNFNVNFSQYVFRFSLKEAKNFQISLGGSFAEYKFISTNESIPCCESFNKTYTLNDDTLFIDNTIKGDDIKTDFVFDIIVKYTKPDSLLSFFDITVIPFDTFPIYYINEGSVNCNTGKNNQIYLVYQAHNTELLLMNTIMHFTSFLGNQYEQYSLSVRWFTINAFESMTTKQIEEIFNNTTFKTLTNYHISLDYIPGNSACFFLIKTDKETKMTFHTSKRYNSLYNNKYDGDMSLTFNEERIIFLCEEKIMQLYIVFQEYNLTNNYAYIFEIEDLGGESAIQIYEITVIQGKMFYYFNNEQIQNMNSFNLYNLYPDYCIALSAKLTAVPKEYNNTLIKLNHVKMSSYSFYNNPFPLFFSMSLQNNFTDFVINLRLRFNFTDLPLYNTSHLNISAFFTDQESINSFNNINSKFTIQKYVSVQKLILQDVAIIEDSDYTNYKQYSHLIIKLEENSKYNSNLPLQIEINPLISYSFNESKYLTKNIYNYGRLLNGYQVYSLSVSSEFLTIEFSANDIEIYNLCLFSSSGNSINETSIIKNNETKIFTFNTNKEDLLFVNVSLNDNEKKDGYHAIKYTTTKTINNFFASNVTNQYEQYQKQIKSKWEKTKNDASNNIINSFYFYALYEISDNYDSKNTLFSTLSPSFSKITKDSSFTYTIEDSMISKKIKIIIVSFFSSDNQDYLRVISNETIKLTRPRNYSFWVTVIFGFILLGIVYCSYVLYKEIRKKEKTIERKKSDLSIEEMNNEF